MDSPAVLTAWLLTAGALLVGGVTTLRRPEQVASSFSTLRVPRTLHRRWIVRAHPWAEILLAVLLLVLPAPMVLAVAVLVLITFSTYLTLVWGAVARGQEGSCHCFGSLGSGRLDGWAVARNAALWLVAAIVVGDAALGGSARDRLAQDTQLWGWAVAVTATAAVTYLVVRDAGSAAPAPEASSRATAYLPVPVPDVDLGAGPGGAPVPLRTLAEDQPQLLLLLNPTCGPCTVIGRRVAGWADEVPGVDFRIVHALSRESVRSTAPEWLPHYATDEGHRVDAALGAPTRPAAVLLGRDGVLLPEPAVGATAITRLVDELRDRATGAGPDRPASSGSGAR